MTAKRIELLYGFLWEASEERRWHVGGGVKKLSEPCVEQTFTPQPVVQISKNNSNMAARKLTDFQVLTRTIFGILRTYHHQQTIRKTIQGSTKILPRVIQTKIQIANTFKPCIPTVDTSHLLQENANNWLQTGLQISDEHHTHTISALLSKLTKMTKEDEQRAWEVAGKWARFKYHNIQKGNFIQAAEDLDMMGIRISHHRTLIPDTTILTTQPKKVKTRRPQRPTGGQSSLGSTMPSLASIVLPSTNLLLATGPRHSQTLTVGVASQNLGFSPIIPLTPTTRRPGSEALRRALVITKTLPEPEPECSRSLTTEDYNLPPTSPTNVATRHEHHGDKKKNWSLTPSREVLIIGSSNISRLPPINNEKIHVDSYLGANLIQAAHLIKYKTPTSEDTKEVLLCFGVNDRNTENIAILDNNLTQLLSSAKKTFPNANIHIPSINFSPGLPLTTIRKLNTLIERTPGHISQLDMKDFSTERDQVHWTQETAKKMWDHWRSSLPL
ncbi:hypothetical protein JOQ06_024209 [Pogonophryne albipinna]|uniref:Uncharacterized protein n=1 Tax=Pogonophryne albipinna TaxID=1090488 RepID=A0AAD6BP01_9TELE|nr:hypothetical protein JOQ06_024209 [Pogonophryne albipinna]